MKCTDMLTHVFGASRCGCALLLLVDVGCCWLLWLLLVVVGCCSLLFVIVVGRFTHKSQLPRFRSFFEREVAILCKLQVSHKITKESGVQS